MPVANRFLMVIVVTGLLPASACSMLPGEVSHSTEPSALASIAASATDRCNRLELESRLPGSGETKVVAAFQVSGQQYLEWHDRLIRASGVDEPGGRAPSASVWPKVTDETLIVCYIDGDLGSPRGNSAGTLPNYSRAIVVIYADGTTDTIAIGYTDGIPVITPAGEQD